MSHDLPLFQWAETRRSAVIIDATERFLAREVAFIRLLIIGYKPPTTGGSAPVNLAEYRAAVANREPKDAVSTDGAAA
jgi:hypothetical protein